MSRYYDVVGSGFLSSLGVTFHVIEHDDGTEVRGTFTLNKAAMGPPGFVHGGLLAALLDEAMGIAAHFSEYKVVSANLNLNYLKPVPLGQPMTVTARVSRKDGRKVYIDGLVTLATGEEATRCEGLFVEAPNLFDGWGFRFIEQVGD
ncbi:MAG: PaaI family thioesterase [Chloroflexota bacterium]